MSSSKDTSNAHFDYQPDRIYTVEEFEKLNDWHKTHDIEIDGTPISHFELDVKGRLIPMPQTPIYKEGVVAEIILQLGHWNRDTGQNGVVTSSQGGFNLSVVGESTIKAPDAAFTPKEVYRRLTQQQLHTFNGPLFSPTFVVEVENLSPPSELPRLTNKFKDVYFPGGVQLGWLIDPIGKEIYIFKRNRSGAVHRRKHGWRDVPGGEVLPDFVLQIWEIEEAVSQMPEVEDDNDKDDLEFHCPRCDATFTKDYTFLVHYRNEHARKKRQRP